MNELDICSDTAVRTCLYTRKSPGISLLLTAPYTFKIRLKPEVPIYPHCLYTPQIQIPRRSSKQTPSKHKQPTSLQNADEIMLLHILSCATCSQGCLALPLMRSCFQLLYLCRV